MRNSGSPLARAQHLAAAQLQVLLGDLEAVLGGLHHLQARRAVSPSGALCSNMQKLSRVPPPGRAALHGPGKTLGMLDHHDVGVGHVDADLDHRRRAAP